MKDNEIDYLFEEVGEEFKRNKNMKILKSRTVWTIVVLFLINGIQGVQDVFPASWLPAITINGLLGIAAIYFRVKPRQEF